MDTRLYLALLIVSLVTLLITPKLYWVVSYPTVMAVIGSSLAFGSISALIAARRLYFLAHVTPHMALLAAPLSAIVLGHKGGDWILAVLLVLVLVWTSGYTLYKGVSSDVIASIMVSFTASATVLALYYAQRIVGAGRVSQLILGDPLLVTSFEGLAALIVGLLVAVFSLSIAREVFFVGVSRETALVSGLKVWIYDFTLYTLMALSVAIMLRITGFLVTSVLTLLPGAIAVIVARGSLQVTLASITIASIASALGLLASISLNMPPSGVTGLILVTIYALARVARFG